MSDLGKTEFRVTLEIWSSDMNLQPGSTVSKAAQTSACGERKPEKETSPKDYFRRISEICSMS